MNLKDIMGGMFPIQSVTSDLAAGGQLGFLPQIVSGMDKDAQMGLMGLLSPQFLGGGSEGSGEQEDPYANMRPEQFLTQTPGAPGQMNRGPMPQGGGMQGQQMDPLAMLDANIMRRYGGGQ